MANKSRTSTMKNLLTDKWERFKERHNELDPDILPSYLEGFLYSRYLTCWDYLQMDILLNLQQPKTDLPDEEIFIIYHQSTELYFRACWGFAFDVENEQILVLRKPFLSRIALLRGEKMAK